MRQRSISGFVLLLLLGAGLTAGAGDVLVATVNGVIGPVSARFIAQGIDRAEQEKANCFLLELDTPGGLEESMRLIVKRMMIAKVPVVVYVAPAGARAASAGTFITLAAHVAAMAPGTTMGAAHPVGLGQSMQTDPTLNEKATNDAAAFIRTIAEKRGRNGVWAENAVRQSVSLSETEAMREKVVDLVAPNRAALLVALDGRTTLIGSDTVTLKTEGVAVTELPMNWRDRLLSAVAHPNFAYILFMIGLLGLYFELSNPGAILPGVAGVISLILAFFAFQTLPVNYAGVLLIVLSIILFIIDVKAATHGVLTAGGLVAMFMGSVMLFSAPEPELRLSLQVIIPVVLVVGGFFALGAWLSLKSQFRKPATGAGGLIGQEGDARSPVNRSGGSVFVAGTHWNAVADTEIPVGRRVKVIAVTGMVLTVAEVKNVGA
jgi:membrane-bound serine protease (ClpP class)